MPTCPICHHEMIKKEADADPKMIVLDTDEYFCRQDDHFFTIHICEETLLRVKVRFEEPQGNKLFMRIDYKDNTTEVWSKANSFDSVVIEQAIVLDFSDVERVKKKIRTYLTFS